MAKTILNGWTKAVSIIITLLVLFATIVSGYTALRIQQKNLCEEIATVKAEGSTVAKENEKSLIAVTKDIEHIKESQKRTERDLRRIARKLGVSENDNE